MLGALSSQSKSRISHNLAFMQDIGLFEDTRRMKTCIYARELGVGISLRKSGDFRMR